ncbi:MAG: ribosome-recycling factor [Gammaproteobacteria bacterium]|jgi:ribosome recycling factor|nr:ribosome-recycling factor [Gammaproteobacteria bacterium]
MINDIINDAQKRMQKSIEALKNDFTKIRTGRAHPSLLEHIRVSYYGSEMPLSQVANVSTADSHTLVVTPWDKAMVAPIEKAIMTSDLGLNPATAGTVIRVPLPALTEERRRDLTKIVRHEAENARVSIRNIRRDMNQDFKELLKDKDITEDEARKAEEKAQELTDKFIAQVEVMAGDKEKELMAI